MLIDSHKIKKLIGPFIITLGCLLFTLNVLAQDIADQKTLDKKTPERALPEFHAKYNIQFYGINSAEAHYRLSYTDTGYQFTQKTNLIGLASLFADDSISAVSIVDEIDNKLLLKKHSYIQTGKKKDRDEHINIDWDTSKNPAKAKITGTVRGDKINLESDTAIWEALSFQLPLMLEARPGKKDYPYKALLKGEIETYNFVLTSSKKISFAYKEYDALQMVRTDPHKDRQLHIWLLPELHNIPVIIENYRKGKVHSRVQLKSVQFNDEKPYLDNLTDDDDEF